MIYADKREEQIPSLRPRAVALWPFACAPSVALPVRICLFQLWPGTFGCLGRRTEAGINPKMTCCGFQPVSLAPLRMRDMPVRYAAGLIWRESFLGAHAREERRWQIHDRLSQPKANSRRRTSWLWSVQDVLTRDTLSVICVWKGSVRRPKALAFGEPGGPPKKKMRVGDLEPHRQGSGRSSDYIIVGE